jgi:hypothetical protein
MLGWEHEEYVIWLIGCTFPLQGKCVSPPFDSARYIYIFFCFFRISRSHESNDTFETNSWSSNIEMGAFVPRTGYPKLTSLPRSYFLGHHRSGLTKMKTMLSTVDLIIECRDYRVPITSRNPMFEESLAGRERVIVYTKRDLGSNGASEDRLVRPSRDCLSNCRADKTLATARKCPSSISQESFCSFLRSQVTKICAPSTCLCSRICRVK